jgi:hypothetical protein
MNVSVAEVCAALETKGLLERQKHNTSERVEPYVRGLIGRDLPADLRDFYREHVYAIGEFRAVWPNWNDRVGWRTPDSLITELLDVQAVPIMGDGCGNLFGLDLSCGPRAPAVYFFDHEDGFERPHYAAGSSLGFLILMSEHDRAFREHWPERWELAIDPDIEMCPRAPAIWFAD